MTEAVLGVTVDDTDSLQVGIDDGGADKGHAAAHEVARDGVGQGRGRAQGVWLVHDGAVGERPKICRKGAELRLDRLKDAAVANGGDKLAAVAEKLPETTFAFCHSSFVVNMPYIVELHDTEVVLESGDTLPISRRYAKAFRQRYFEWADQWTV